MQKRFLNALAYKNHSSPPIWLMRQAGRYLPEFRALRQKYSFLELCHQPELAVEVTQQPLKRFGFDAAILFSDILVVAEALGAGLHFKEGVGPVIVSSIRQASDIEGLRHTSAAETLGYVGEAIRCLKSCLEVPLIGFCGAPFTVAGYLVEGGHSDALKRTKQWLFCEPAGFHRLLERVTAMTLDYLKLQIAAGVDAIQIFDSWAMHLPPAQFREFSMPYIDRLIREVKSLGIPVIFFCRGAAAFLTTLRTLAPTGLSLDWGCDLAAVVPHLPHGMAIQGNLDPDLLYAPLKVVESEISRLLGPIKGHPGYIFNLGHGIKPDTPLDAVYTLVETVRKAPW